MTSIMTAQHIDSHTRIYYAKNIVRQKDVLTQLNDSM